MSVSVTLMDGRTINLPVDSASTSKEICHMLFNKVKLTDTFGFSLYVTLYEKVGGHIHLMQTFCSTEVGHFS